MKINEQSATQTQSPESSGEMPSDAEVYSELGLGGSPVESGSEVDDADDAGDGAGGSDAGGGNLSAGGDNDGDDADDGDETDDGGGDEAGEADGDGDGDGEDGSDDDADDESGDDADEDESDDQGADDKPRSVKKLQRRVDKLTGRLKDSASRVQALETDNQDLNTKLTTAQSPVMAPTADSPLADQRTAAEVDAYVSQMEAVRDWCEENADGAEVKTAEGTQMLEAKEVRQRKRYAEAVINRHAPARKEMLKAQTQFDANARQVYPQLFKSDSQESKIADLFIKQNPQILNLPNYRLIIGDAIRGMAARLAEVKGLKTDTGKAQATQVQPKKAPARAVKPTAAPATTQQQARSSRTNDAFRKSGTVNDLAAAIESGEVF